MFLHFSYRISGQLKSGVPAEAAMTCLRTQHRSVVKVLQTTTPSAMKDTTSPSDHGSTCGVYITEYKVWYRDDSQNEMALLLNIDFKNVLKIHY